MTWEPASDELLPHLEFLGADKMYWWKDQRACLEVLLIEIHM